MNIDDLIKVLQASIAPCVLISGIGLLLLSMTNRLARPIDRLNVLIERSKSASDQEMLLLHQQISILYKRCRLLRGAIAWMGIGIFFASVIILLLFSIYIFQVPFEPLVQFLFMATIICVILSISFFLWDIRLTLRSIAMEVKKYLS